MTMSPKYPQPFTLEIDFAGLCFFVHDKNGDRTTVVLPDARINSVNDQAHIPGGLQHRDGSPARPHVGYLRFDLSCFDDGGERLDYGIQNTDPAYHVLHLFDRDELTFDPLTHERSPLSQPQPRRPTPDELPTLENFAPCLQPDPAILTSPAAHSVLARMTLNGGTFQTIGGGRNWTIPKTMSPIAFPGESTPVYVGQFTKTTVWTRDFVGEGVEISVLSLDGASNRVLKLAPTIESTVVNDEPTTRRIIRLAIGNLCCENPFDLEAMDPQPPPPPVTDTDFKWFYWLLRLDPTHQHQIDFRATHPVPTPDPDGDEGDLQGCTSLQAFYVLP